MNIFARALALLGQGFMFGIGFVLAAWGAYFLFQGTSKALPAPMSVESDMPSIAARSANTFEAHDVEEVKRNDRVYFIGKVKNIGRSPASASNIQVDLFKDGKFVDQYSTYLSGPIGPGEEQYFKITCGCKDEAPAEHDSYKISVIGGY